MTKLPTVSTDRPIFPFEFFPLETLELPEKPEKLELKLGLEPFIA